PIVSGAIATAPDGKTSTLHTTAHHPFWDATTGAWVDAAALVAGHQLRTADQTIATVIAVRSHTGAKDMHDLTVASVHTYYVLAGSTPVLVHNDGDGFVVPAEFQDGQFWGFGWDTPAGRVDGYAIVKIAGSKITFNDAAIYGPGRKT